jgi:hypothetical protein
MGVMCKVGIIDYLVSSLKKIETVEGKRTEERNIRRGNEKRKDKNNPGKEITVEKEYR